MTTQADIDRAIDQATKIVEEKLGKREASVKAFEEQRANIRTKVQNVREVAVAALRDADQLALANLVNERLGEIAGLVWPGR